jgi:hypothetical protein
MSRTDLMANRAFNFSNAFNAVAMNTFTLISDNLTEPLKSSLSRRNTCYQ